MFDELLGNNFEVDLARRNSGTWQRLNLAWHNDRAARTLGCLRNKACSIER